MRTMGRLVALSALVWAIPAPAMAAESEIPAVLETGAGILALVAAAFLLVIIVRLEKVARGSAIAESVGLVVAAALTLGASVLTSWLGRQLTDVSASQARLGADLLVVVSMALFGVYFMRVRAALTRFLRGSEEILAKIQAAEEDYEEPHPVPTSDKD
jgi:Kef-type K+ transport system membrane component KefB